MKATVTIHVEADNLDDLQRVESALHSLRISGVAGIVLPDAAPVGGCLASEPAAIESPASEPAEPAKPAKPAKPASGRKSKNPPTEDDAVTLDQVKEAVRDAIAAGNTDMVKSVFAQHKAKKMSDLEPGSYAAVVEALRG